MLFLSATSFFIGVQKANAQPISVGGNITMSISTGVAGGALTSVVNTTITLSYRRQNALAKITVATSCPAQSFTLKVLAIPAKPPANVRTCTLQYIASATFAQGNSTEDGNDVHTVTYTILAQ
jgi:hypothetical protein